MSTDQIAHFSCYKCFKIGNRDSNYLLLGATHGSTHSEGHRDCSSEQRTLRLSEVINILPFFTIYLRGVEHSSWTLQMTTAPSLKVNMKLTMNYSITRDQFSTDTWRWGLHFIPHKSRSGNLSKLDNIQAKMGIFNAKWPILQDIWEKYNLPFSQIQQ